jgi:hypothetical protein
MSLLIAIGLRPLIRDNFEYLAAVFLAGCAYASIKHSVKK